jgi:putative membrane-bound dehydrogenase-like protein
MKSIPISCFKVFAAVLCFGILNSCSERSHLCDNSPCEPDEAINTFEITEGFRIELFASEPLIQDPVGMDVDEAGRIYVVQDPGYPEKLGGNGSVHLLEDTNGDGFPDRSTLFADSLQAPRGVMRWKQGVLVTDAPDILYFEDTTGDGKADLKEVLMSGFARGNPQLGVNTPKYGLDNWIYAAHRMGSSRPYFKDQPGEERLAGSSNIRFRPDSYEWESTSAASQFGHTFDAFGRPLYAAWNNHVYQEVIDSRYLRRNPDLLVAPSTANISDHGSVTDVFPITKDPRHELFTLEGTTTATCGIKCYLGGAFPSEYQGATFVAEPAHNIVHADRITEDGTTLTAQRMHEDREFLASTDRWFRPVNSYIGPDGALYVIDYYREVIEQPRFLSEEVLEAGILYDGSDRGRIYRITAEGAEAPSWPGRLNLGEMNSSELAELLEHENIWWRRTAQRILVDRRDETAAESLEQLALSSDLPAGRSHALWTLEGIGALTPSLIEQSLRDSSPRVREQAIRLAEHYIDNNAALAAQLLEMESDPDPRVRFQLLATLGELNTDEAHRVREKMLYEYIDDEWMQMAALSAPDLSYSSLFDEALVRLSGRETDGRQTYFERLGMLMGVRQNPEEVRRLMDSFSGFETSDHAWWQAASLNGLASGLRRGDDPDESLGFVRGTVAAASLLPGEPALRNAARQVLAVVGPPAGDDGDQIFHRAEEIAADRNEDAELRSDAIGLLELAGTDRYEELLTELIDPREPAHVQEASARALRHIGGSAIGEFLLSQWNRMTPPVQAAAMEALLEDDERIALVLNAVKQGEVPRSAVSPTQTNRLMLHPDDELRLQAQNLLGLPDEPRSEVVARYMQVEDLEGSPERGRTVYERACAMCHQIDGEAGVPFGPDLAGSRNSDTEGLLVSILMPNSEIAAGYQQWRVIQRDGSSVQGTIVSESPGSVTFRNPAGQETTLSRNNIETMEAMQESAMPEGLEQQISVEEMADLISFIKNQ